MNQVRHVFTFVALFVLASGCGNPQDPPASCAEHLIEACDGCGSCVDGAAVCDERVGMACGTCDGGMWSCVEGSVICNGGDAGINACGGCLALDHADGDGCGTCDSGRWQCDDGGLTCVGDLGDEALDVCGGCTGLDVIEGDRCDGGQWMCDATMLVCMEEECHDNVCGGCEMLDHQVGEACGPCNMGRWMCQGRNRVQCVDAIEPNACGGCGELSDEPGGCCGPCASGRWRCTEDGEQVTCEGARTPDSMDACGGCGLGDEIPGEPCGRCGVWTCTEDKELLCVAGEDCAATAEAFPDRVELRNLGRGTYVYTRTQTAVSGDLSGDGVPDLVLGVLGPHVHFGPFPDESDVHIDMFEEVDVDLRDDNGIAIYRMRIADLDQDGTSDLIYARSGWTHVYWGPLRPGLQCNPSRDPFWDDRPCTVANRGLTLTRVFDDLDAGTILLEGSEGDVVLLDVDNDPRPAVYVVRGPIARTSDTELLLERAEFVLHLSDQFSRVLGSVDVNGDGHNDLIASEPANYDVHVFSGRLLVFFGPLEPGTWLAKDADLVVHGRRLSEDLGWFLQSAGDVNGDGVEDVLVGSDYEKNLATILYGDREQPLARRSRVSGRDEQEGCGNPPATAPGDLNGDGFADLVVSVAESRGAECRLHVFWGPLPLGGVEPATADRIFRKEDAASLSAEFVGDLTGDGVAEFLVFGDGGHRERVQFAYPRTQWW